MATGNVFRIIGNDSSNDRRDIERLNAIMNQMALQQNDYDNGNDDYDSPPRERQQRTRQQPQSCPLIFDGKQYHLDLSAQSPITKPAPPEEKQKMYEYATTPRKLLSHVMIE